MKKYNSSRLKNVIIIIIIIFFNWDVNTTLTFFSLFVVVDIYHDLFGFMGDVTKTEKDPQKQEWVTKQTWLKKNKGCNIILQQ